MILGETTGFTDVDRIKAIAGLLSRHASHLQGMVLSYRLKRLCDPGNEALVVTVAPTSHRAMSTRG